MSNKYRTVIFCENSVKRAKKKSKKPKPPSYKQSQRDFQPMFSCFVNSPDIPRIPPPPYETYEDYCKRTSKLSENPFDGYAPNPKVESNFEWSSEINN